jgi:hypothetical protein
MATRKSTPCDPAEGTLRRPVGTATATSRCRSALRREGIDPGTAGAQLTARLLEGTSARTTEDRLRELTDLRDRGVITADEYTQARAHVLPNRKPLGARSAAEENGPVQPTARQFRDLARSSPWRWRTLRFRLRRRGSDTVSLRAWVRRPDSVRVEELDGTLLEAGRWEPVAPAPLAVTATRPGRGPAEETRPDDDPEFGPDGLVRRRPFARNTAEEPMYRDYFWVAMLDPVELADPPWHDDPEAVPVLVDQVREVEHHGRRAWEALLRPTPAYDPRCDCCALLFSAESEARTADAGGLMLRAQQPELRYADAHRVRLDVETAVCVYTEEVGGSRPGIGHEVVIEAVDEPMSGELFRAPPHRRWWRRT